MEEETDPEKKSVTLQARVRGREVEQEQEEEEEKPLKKKILTMSQIYNFFSRRTYA